MAGASDDAGGDDRRIEVRRKIERAKLSKVKPKERPKMAVVSAMKTAVASVARNVFEPMLLYKVVEGCQQCDDGGGEMQRRGNLRKQTTACTSRTCF